MLETKKRKFLEKIKEFKHKEIIIFVLIMFIAYLATLSCSWDDEDSILFIKGVREFNVAEYQPHPPGYPVYIFLGKISVFLMQDELLGLTILSAIFGALSLAVFYFLIFEMFDKKIALMATMIMGVTPLFWLYSLKAMSDMAGLFFILLSLYFIYSSIKYEQVKTLYIASFISAIAIGVRFHALFIVIPLLIYSCFKITRKKKGLKGDIIFYCPLTFFIGILAWFIPILVINGFFGYFGAALGQFLIRFDNPYTSTLAGSFSFDYLYSRAISFISFFLAEGYGINIQGPNILPIILLLAYLSILFFSYEKLKDKRILFFVVGLFFYLIMVLLFLTPSNPRYFLPLIPFISLLFVLGISWFGRNKYFVFAFLFLLLLISSAPLAIKIHITESAPIQLVNYLEENYNPEEIILFADPSINRYLSHYNISSNSFTILLKDARDLEKKETLTNETIFDSGKKVLVINPRKEIMQNHIFSIVKKFHRDFRIHPKHNTVYLYEMKKVDAIH